MTTQIAPLADYPIIMRRRNGRVHLFIRELGLSASATSLDEAHTQLEHHAAAMIAEIKEAGMEDCVIPPGGHIQTLTQPASVWLRVSATVVLAVAILIGGGMVSRQVNDLRRTVDRQFNEIKASVTGLPAGIRP